MLMSSVKRPSPRTRVGSSVRSTGWPIANLVTDQRSVSFCMVIGPRPAAAHSPDGGMSFPNAPVRGGKDGPKGGGDACGFRPEIEDESRSDKDLGRSYAPAVHLL